MPTAGLEGTTTDTRGFLLGEANVASGVTIQPDGKIVAVGAYASGAFRLERQRSYNASPYPSGAYDPTFVGGGRLLVPSPGVSEGLSAVAVRPDGRIVAAGGSDG